MKSFVVGCLFALVACFGQVGKADWASVQASLTQMADDLDDIMDLQNSNEAFMSDMYGKLILFEMTCNDHEMNKSGYSAEPYWGYVDDMYGTALSEYNACYYAAFANTLGVENDMYVYNDYEVSSSYDYNKTHMTEYESCVAFAALITGMGVDELEWIAMDSSEEADFEASVGAGVAKVAALKAVLQACNEDLEYDSELMDIWIADEAVAYAAF
jgi:hypothetical protein